MVPVQNAIVLCASAAICALIADVGKTSEMEAFNHEAEFTKWVVSAGLLTDPFVSIDVGVQGRENIRCAPWAIISACMVLIPSDEVIQALIEGNRGRSSRHYH